MKFLSAYKEQAYAIMRIVTGLLFIQHGIQKMIMISGGQMPANNILMILAMIIETVAGLLVIIGWQTRPTAFIASGEMAVAYFKGHAAAALLPINNKGELAVIYCFVFLFIATYGAGIWSVDGSLTERSRSEQ
ncbi:MAG TPA: DoxX family protein [Bacteroidales bacterium]|jgi:putative oxidoreductase|nr:DoxX family protein [Bacteroidales bacterium]